MTSNATPLEKTLNSLNLGFRLTFLGIYARWITENDLLIDLDIDGTYPLEKTLSCFNLGFRLPFLGIYVGWWAQGTLLLFRLNQKCTNYQAEKLAILAPLQYKEKSHRTDKNSQYTWTEK